MLLVVSFAAKAFREEICNNFQDDPISERLDKIKQRYQANQAELAQRLAEKQQEGAAGHHQKSDQRSDEGAEHDMR